MPIPLLVMWFGVAGSVLFMLLAAYTPPTTKGRKSESVFCLVAGIFDLVALAPVFWLS